MLDLDPHQHAKILGWGIIGFGAGLILGNLEKFWLLTQVNDKTGVSWISALSTFGVFVISVVAGIIIKDDELDPKVLGLIFIVAAIATFPFGTILGAYTLFFLFVIRDAKERDSSGSEATDG